MANDHSNSSHEEFPRVRQNTKRTHVAEQTGTAINKTNQRRIIHESVSMGESLVGHISSSDNIADLMTKVTKGKYYVGNILCDLHDDH